MVDRDVFDRRLDHLESLIGDLRELSATSTREQMAVDRAVQAQAERWLHLAVECVLDLANHLVSDRGWQSPTTYRETFTILRDNGVLDADLASRMEGWAGLRNILVHLYLMVDHGRIWEIMQTDLDELEQFARCIHNAIKDR